MTIDTVIGLIVGFTTIVGIFRYLSGYFNNTLQEKIAFQLELERSSVEFMLGPEPQEPKLLHAFLPEQAQIPAFATNKTILEAKKEILPKEIVLVTNNTTHKQIDKLEKVFIKETPKPKVKRKPKEEPVLDVIERLSDEYRKYRSEIEVAPVEPREVRPFLG